MKANRFKAVRDAGGTPLGHMIGEFVTRGIAQIVDAAGVDFVVIDMEHASTSISEAADLIAWLKATTIAPFVRIPEVQYHHTSRVMDAGALGVVAPNVRTAEQARALVDAAKYLPVGRRGFCHGGANSDFRTAEPQAFREYMDYAIENTTVMCLIESPEGVENLDAIAGTAGVDALWAGFADLAQYMGISGQFEDARFIDALKRIADAAHRHGLAAIIQPSSVEQLLAWRTMGYDTFSYATDYTMYGNALAGAIAEAAEAVRN
ncbi:MAG: hypothetical protein CMJ49_02430 [Planctomycetaceae bacterium]|nr:hypothetical protein [Planctomycetaceae bacterium]